MTPAQVRRTAATTEPGPTVTATKIISVLTDRM
jgi:hypothetical protein